MDRNAHISRLATTAVVIGIVTALYFGKSLFVPFALAMLFSLILAPLVSLAQRTGLPRTPSVIGVVVLAFALLGWGTWVVAGQVASLGTGLPAYKENFRKRAASVGGPVGPVVRRLDRFVQDIQSFPPDPSGTASPDVVKVQVVNRDSVARFLQGAVGTLIATLGTAAVVVTLVVFFLVYSPDIRDRFIRLVGDNQVNLTTRAMNEATSSVSRYLLAQSLLNAAYGVAFGVGLYLFGVPNAALWGFLAAVLRFIPYVGAWVAAGAAVLLSLAVFDGWARPLGVVGFIVALELLSNNVLEPWVYGNRTGMSPLGVIIAAIFWAWLWGGVGLILAVPITGCLVVVARHVPQLRFLAVILGSEPALEATVRLYHRLLAMDQEEAAEVLEESRAGMTWDEVLDRLIVPVLAMAEDDRHRGRLEENACEGIRSEMRELVAGAEGEPAKAEEVSGVRVMCLASADAADELVAEIFARHLSTRGLRAEAVSHSAMSTEKVEQVRDGDSDIVCISALPPTAVVQARYLYKRLRQRFPEIPIIVGLWTEKSDVKRLMRHIASDGKAILVSSIAEAEREIRQQAARIVMERHPGSQGATEAARLSSEQAAPEAPRPGPTLRERLADWWRRVRPIPRRA